jgi:hypothetical protein
LDCDAGGSDAGGLVRWIAMQVVWLVGLQCRWFGSLVLMQVVRLVGSDAGGSACWIAMQVVLMQVVWLVGSDGGLARWIAMQVVRFVGSDAGGSVRWF